MATKSSLQSFNLVRYVNAPHALFSILRYNLPREDRPALKITYLAKEIRNSRAIYHVTMQGIYQLLSNIGRQAT